MAVAYIANENPQGPLLSGIYSDLHGLRQMLIQVGTNEVLLDDAKRLSENAEKAGVFIQLEIWDAMFHVFQYFVSMLPERQEAINKIAAFVHNHAGMWQE